MEASHNKAQLNLIWEGSQFVTSSLALINREHCANVIDSGVANVEIVPFEADQFSYEGNPKFEKLWQHDVRSGERTLPKLPTAWVRHQWPPKREKPKGAKWIIKQPWEFTTIRKDFYSFFKDADEIWTPSNFSRNAFVNSGLDPDKVQVIPNGVDPKIFSPKGVVPELPTKKTFRFLYVGGTIYRKGIDVLLDAYVRAFTADDDVCLVIKDVGGSTYYRNQNAEQIIAQIRQNPKAPEILYSKSAISEEQIAELYRACDVLVSPYRGEGFSMPTLEAMACGIPVMVSAGGATEDFVDETVGWFIPTKPEGLGDTIDGHELTGPAFMLKPDADALVELMQQVVMYPQTRIDKGIRAALRARTQWTWNKATLKMLSRLDYLFGTTTAVEAQETLKDEDDVMTTFGRAEWFNERGRIDEAIELYHVCFKSRALPLKYQMLALHRMASYCLLDEDTELCLEYLDKARTFYEGHPDTAYIQSVYHAMRGEWIEALEVLTDLLNGWKQHKYETMVYIQLDTLLCDSARALFATGAIEEAHELYTKALEQNPENPEACMGAARCFRGVGAVVEARTMFEWAIRLKPEYELDRAEFEDVL